MTLLDGNNAVEQATRRLEKTPLTRQVIQQGSPRRKAGIPPAHLKSIDFSGLTPYGRPGKEAQKHFTALIKIKAGVWNGGK
jgi:hypothetical protein